MQGLYYGATEILSEKEKNSEDYLVNTIDMAIAELVIEKDHLRKAYNYYNGQRDQDQFKYLEDNYGLGNSTSVEFIPLIRRHVDALVGEHLQNKIKPKITCKDSATLNSISEQQKAAVSGAEVSALRAQLHANIMHVFQHPEDKAVAMPPADQSMDHLLEELKRNVTKNFISTYEIAAQDVVTHLTQSKQVDLYHKLKNLFLDILIAGQCFYKVDIVHEGDTPVIEVLNPFDVFFDKNPNSPYIKTAPRVVHRRWMYRDQILTRYGEFLTKEDLKELQSIQPAYFNNDYFYMRGESGGLVSNAATNMQSNLPYLDGRNYSYNLIPVYEVEWLSSNKYTDENGKAGYRTDRYAGVRIGQDIYVDMGKVEVTRSAENPHECYNSINGIFYSDRNGSPYSLVLATANLQDKYDLLHFFRDTLIATSGTKGDWLDMAQLPTALGADPMERLIKWLAYKKSSGVALINTAQEGRGANHNTIFAGYDNTVSGQSLQAIQLAIQQTEDICSSISGVFRERLGAIEQRDAVTNVDVGIKQSAIITKQYYQVMDNITTELLIDALNACKESYKEGVTGSIMLGDGMQKVFTIDPQHFSFTDYDINIADSGDIIRDMQKIESLTMELIKSGQADLDIIFNCVGVDSLTEMKQDVLGAYAKKKQENDAVKQLQQQLQQIQQQAQQIQQELQKAQQENEVLKNKATTLENKAIDNDYDIRKENNRNTREYNQDRIKLEEDKIGLQKVELFDNNNQNDKINQSLL